MFNIHLKIADESDLDQIYEIMRLSFPYQERRAKYDVKKLLNEREEVFLKIVDNSKIVGIIAYRDFSKIRFFEYFAVHPDYKGRGIGSVALKNFISDFLQSDNETLVLEVEKPIDEIARRRIAFYKSFDFRLNDYDYNQPNYHTAKPVPMFLMTYKKSLSFSEFNIIKNKLYDVIYANQIKKLPNIYK